MKRIILGIVLAVLAFSASASVVQFSGSPATTFADGTFSTNLSGDYADGFATLDNVTAFNNYGQNGEFINFNGPVTLNSLVLMDATCCALTATTVTANLFNSSNTLLSSQTWASGSTQTLIFNTANVSQVVFNFTGGTNFYGDGRTAAWYEVSNITYNAAPVPEPETYGMMIAGLGLMGFMVRRKRSA